MSGSSFRNGSRDVRVVKPRPPRKAECVLTFSSGEGSTDNKVGVNRVIQSANNVMVLDATVSDSFTETPEGRVTVVGIGSLLSETSARSTFPELQSFSVAKIYGYRRVFAHTAPIFFERGIANAETEEISSLGVEPADDPWYELWVTCFDFEATPEAIEAFIDREHEFKFVAVQPYSLEGEAFPYPAVVCCRWTDEEYRRTRCPDAVYEEKFGKYGIDRIYRDDILPCRLYLRHCYLAAKALAPPAALENFLDTTFLADRKTTMRAYLALHPEILEEQPPAELIQRYSG